MKKTFWAKLVNTLEMFEFIITFFMKLSGKFQLFEAKNKGLA